MRKKYFLIIVVFFALAIMHKGIAQQSADFQQPVMLPETPGVYSLNGTTLKLTSPVVSLPLYHHTSSLNTYSNSNNGNNNSAVQINKGDLQNQSLPEDKYAQNMNQICADYYKNRASRNFTTAPNYIQERQIVDRQVMSFSHFAQSCEDYYNNNKLLQDGLNPE